jgi:peptidoglycan hydrolase-like protein with peptidoglycan-binding domain
VVTPPAPVGDWNSIPSLAYGNTGPAVLHFQQFMVRMFPAYNRYTPNGIYGPATAAGLKEFQGRSGVSGGDGRNVGPQTKQALWKAGFRP